jgi:23S rRNA (cytidine2498-2'-O)-methyltransferase
LPDPAAGARGLTATFDIRPLGATAYLAAEGFEKELADELGGAAPSHGERLFVVPGAAQPAAWAQNTWPELVELRFGSIGEAAKALRSLGRNWAHHPLLLHRRSSLIAEKLPHVSAKPLAFPAAAPTAPLGAWTLLEPDRLIASARATSPFPSGEAQFIEDREGSPSRAYLKLWEALALARRWPGPGQRCLDLGASPGGWTWALAKLGATVDAVDKAPLDPRVAAMPGVTERLESAFGLDPAKEPPYDWVVSDIVCYPERLVRLVQSWLEAQPKASYVVTVKFQGETELAPLAPLRAVPGSTLLHLSHNKHELTWMRMAR